MATDHPQRGQAVPSLMREPEKCNACGYYHMPKEACRTPIACCTCGAPAGVYYVDAGNPDRECHSCFRERTE